MLLPLLMLDPDAKIDFYASSVEALEFIRTIVDNLPPSRVGKVYEQGFGNTLPGNNPLVVMNPNDLNTVFYAGDERVFIFVENEHFRQTRGLLSQVSLFLCRDPKDATIRRAFSDKHQQVQVYESAKQLAALIVQFIDGITPKKIEQVEGESVGLVYMAFGPKAALAVRKSVATLRRVGFDYNVCVVGDTPVEGFQFVPWTGESPFDPTQRKNFMFRAGRVKPFLYELSPFKRTLYLDADTQFLGDISAGFNLLNDTCLAITQEYLTVGELYNKFMAGWEINIEERAQTIKEGISPDEPFVNSGVIFFKKTNKAKETFSLWHKEWMRYQQWDEQLSLMRAIYQVQPERIYLSPKWNDPQIHEDTIIFHDYGHGHVRMNV